MNITPSHINLFLSLFVLLFIMSGFLWGIVRGLKKSAFRGIWLLCFLILCLILSQTITNALIKMDLTFLNLKYNGNTVVSIKDFIIQLINEQIGNDTLTKLPSLVVLIEKLPLIICSPFVFTFLFFATKILLWPLWAILSRIFFKKQKVENKSVVIRNIDNTPQFVESKQQKEQQFAKDKPKKHALLGGLIGTITGLVCCCALLVPVFGFLNVTRQLNNIVVPAEALSNTSTIQTVNQTNDETTLLEYMFQDYSEYIMAIDKSIGMEFLKISQIERLGTAQFTLLSSTNINGANLSLLNEVNNGLKILNNSIVISNFDINTTSQQEMSDFITSIKNTLSIVPQFQIVKIVEEDVINYICDGILNDEEFFITLPKDVTPNVKILLTKTIEKLSTYNINHLTNCVIDFVDILEIFNDEDIILPTVQNKVDFNSIESVSQFISNISEDFSNNLTNKLLEIDLLSNIMPYVPNAIFESICNVSEISFEPTEVVDNNELYSQYFENLLNNSLNILTSFTNENKYYLTDKTFESLGNLIEDFKKQYTIGDKNYYVLSPITFENMLNKVKETAKNALGTIDFELDNIIQTNFNNLTTTTDFKNEFAIYGNAYNLAIPYVEKFIESKNLADVSNLSISNLGKAVDILNTSALFKNSINKIYNYALNNYVADLKINNNSLQNLVNVLIIPENSNIVWEQEFLALNPLYSQLTGVLDNFTSNNIMTSDFLKSFGANLQNIKERNNGLTSSTTALLNIDNILIESLNLLKSLDLEQEIKDVLTDVQSSIQDFTNKPQIDYSIEFTHISSLLDELNKTNLQLKDCVNTLNVIVNGSSDIPATKILDKALFNAIINYIPLASDYSNTAIINILNNSNNNIANYKNGTLEITEYKKELNSIIKIANMLEDINNLDLNSSEIDNIILQLSQNIDYVQNNSSIFNNIKTESINYVFDLIISDITDAQTLNILTVAKSDIYETGVALTDMYYDLNNLMNIFEDANYTEDDFKNTTTLNEINEKLKDVLALESFKVNTSNALYATILDDLNVLIQSINTNDYSSPYKENMETYKEEFSNLIANEVSALSSITEQDVQNDYYLNSLTKIKEKLELKPTGV